MEKDNIKLEILDDPKASLILLAVIYHRKAGISAISRFVKVEHSALESIIREIETLGFVKAEDQYFSVNWDILMSEILNLQREWIWNFEKPCIMFLQNMFS